MFDQLMGLILLGLGIQSPVTGPAVKGDQIEEASESTHRRAPRTTNIMWLDKELRDSTIASRSGIKGKHEAFREKLRHEQEKFRESFEEHIASAEARLESKKEEFEAKLIEFKDEKKKEKIEKIQERLEEYNSKLTDRATEHVAKISELLDKIIEKVQKEEENGKDTTLVDAAISSAQTAIVAAQTAIATQAAKTYVVPLSTEEDAQSDTVTTTKALSTDAKTMHDAVVAARKSVSSVIRELAKLRGEPVPEAIIK